MKTKAMKIAGILLSILMLATLIGAFAVTVSAAEDVSVNIDTGATVTLKDTDGDGYYEIGTADELYAFAALAEAKNHLSVELTNNIIVNDVIFTYENGTLSVTDRDGGTVDTATLRAWTPIGKNHNSSNTYAKTFDGNGYCISGLYCDATSQDNGLFARAGKSTSSGLGASFKNLGVVNSFFGGKQSNTATFIGYNYGSKFENCYSNAIVIGGFHSGGFVANSSNSNRVTIKDSYYFGTLVNGHNGGVLTSEYTYDQTIQNSYYLDGCATYVKNDAAISVSFDDISSGKLAYLLGSQWGQELGKDAYPVPGDMPVYFNNYCDSTSEYSNTAKSHKAIVHVEAKEPTCYEPGNSEYWLCEDCRGLWNDEACTSQTYINFVFLAARHVVVHVEANDPTCYGDGNMEYWYCEECGQHWLDAELSLYTNSEAVVIDAYHNNNLEYHPEREAIDCATPGNIEHWYCPSCMEYFSDAYGEIFLNPWYIEVNLDCVRPEWAADCQTVTCETCGNDIYGFDEHDVLACQGGICTLCGDEVDGYGCANYDTPACMDGVCYYCGGFVAGFGHENGAWAPCCDGECAYGCGLFYPATEEHEDEDQDEYCDSCWNHLYHVFDENGFDPCTGGMCDICWDSVPGEHDENDFGYCGRCQVKFTGASLSLGVDLTMNYYVAIYDEYLIEDGQVFAMIFTMNGNSVTVYANEELVDGEYVFEFKGIAPQCMADSIDAILVSVDENGNVIERFSEHKSHSVKENAKLLLDQYSENAKLVQLVVDLLTYGAAAQNYREYHVDNLANKELSADLTPSAWRPDQTDKRITASESDTVYFVSATVWFDRVNRIAVKLSTTENVTLKVNGEAVELTDVIYYTDAIYAIDFDKVYTFELYEGDTLVQMLSYSISSYVYSMMDQTEEDGETPTEMAELAIALYNYGRSARRYHAPAFTESVEIPEGKEALTAENVTAFSYDGSTAIYDENGWTPVLDGDGNYSFFTITVESGTRLGVFSSEETVVALYNPQADLEYSGLSTPDECGYVNIVQGLTYVLYTADNVNIVVWIDGVERW